MLENARAGRMIETNSGRRGKVVGGRRRAVGRTQENGRDKVLGGNGVFVRKSWCEAVIRLEEEGMSSRW